MRRIVLVLTGALVMAVMLATNVSTALSAPDISMDTSFGNRGNVTTDFFGHEDDARGIAIQPDGKLVVAGSAEDTNTPGWFNDFALARYNSDGSLDTSFGNGGKVITDFAGGNDEARAVAIQQDGKIVAGGYTWNASTDMSDQALVRYNADGTFDTKFNKGSGKVSTALGHDASIDDLAIQQDGKIVSAGRRINDATYYDFSLVRYLPQNGASG